MLTVAPDDQYGISDEYPKEFLDLRSHFVVASFSEPVHLLVSRPKDPKKFLAPHCVFDWWR